MERNNLPLRAYMQMGQRQSPNKLEHASAAPAQVFSIKEEYRKGLEE